MDERKVRASRARSNEFMEAVKRERAKNTWRTRDGGRWTWDHILQVVDYYPKGCVRPRITEVARTRDAAIAIMALHMLVPSSRAAEEWRW